MQSLHIECTNSQSQASHCRSRRRTAEHCNLQSPSAKAKPCRRSLLHSGLAVFSALLAQNLPSQAVEQGVKASDYTVPALSSTEYVARIKGSRADTWASLYELIDSQRFMELSNNLVLPPVDDIRQFVLYIPSALLKEGKQKEAIGSRKAYTDYLRELKTLDELSQKASRFEADEEDVKESLDRLSKRLDSVVSFVK